MSGARQIGKLRMIIEDANSQLLQWHQTLLPCGGSPGVWLTERQWKIIESALTESADKTSAAK